MGFMKSTATLFLSILLSFSCAKKPEDKYPENYKRDYFNLSPLETKVLLITSKKSEEKAGKRKVLFKINEHFNPISRVVIHLFRKDKY